MNQYNYQPGDRVELNTKYAFEASHTDGMTGTVEWVENRYGKPIYHVVLDEPIQHPGCFFSNLSEDRMHDGFVERWLRPSLKPMIPDLDMVDNCIDIASIM